MLEGLSDNARFLLLMAAGVLILLLIGASQDDRCAKWPVTEREACYQMLQDEADYYNSTYP